MSALALLFAASASAAGLPAKLWSLPALPAVPPSPVDLRAELSPPAHQGDRSTCSVFAAACLGEHLWLKARQERLKLSEQHLYWSAKLRHTELPERRVYRREDGLAGFVAVEALGSGLLPAAAWPYDGRAPQPGRTRLSRLIGRPPAGWRRRLRTDYEFTPVAVPRDRIGSFLLAERRPVVLNLMLYFDAVDHASGRVRLPTEEERRLCLSRGEGCGGHVVALVGYDPGTAEFIFRNSWGPGWGRGGYGTLPERYVLEHCETCHLLPRLDGLSGPERRMVESAALGWSGELR